MQNETGSAALEEAPWFSKSLYKDVVHWGPEEWFAAISCRLAMNEWLRASEPGGTIDRAVAKEVLAKHVRRIRCDPIKTIGQVYAESARLDAVSKAGASPIYDVNSREQFRDFHFKDGFRMLAIDLHAPDAVLLPTITAWLSEKRKELEGYTSISVGGSRITAADLRQWLDSSALELVDIELHLRATNQKVSNSRLADALFSDQRVDRVEKLRKVARRHADTLLTVDTYRRLGSQLTSKDWNENYKKTFRD